MRRLLVAAVTMFMLALGPVSAQSTEYFGVSLSFGEFGLPLPMLGVHVGFDDLIAKDVGIKLRLTGIAIGASGEFVAAGIGGADVIWRLPAGDEVAMRPYVGAGPGFVFGGLSGVGFEVAPYAGVVVGASWALDALSIFIEGRGNVILGSVADRLWWPSIAVGLSFTP